MSEEVKKAAQKVVDARKAEDAAWFAQKDLEPRTPEWFEAQDVLEKATKAVTRLERNLTTIVLNEAFGKIGY